MAVIAFSKNKAAELANGMITIRNCTCGKVMFSQVCVKNYVHRGKGRCSPSQTDTSPGQTPPPPTAIAADGTHPTGMHSCLNILILGDSEADQSAFRLIVAEYH